MIFLKLIREWRFRSNELVQTRRRDGYLQREQRFEHCLPGANVTRDTGKRIQLELCVHLGRPHRGWRECGDLGGWQ